MVSAAFFALTLSISDLKVVQRINIQSVDYTSRHQWKKNYFSPGQSQSWRYKTLDQLSGLQVKQPPFYCFTERQTL